MIDWPLQYLLSLDGLPEWARQILPFAWHAALAIGIMVLAYIVAQLVKVAIRLVGQRRLAKRHEDYDGSSWDLADSAIQAMIILAGVPFALSVFGFEITPYFATYGTGILTAITIIVVAAVLSRWIGSSIRQFGDKARRSHRADGTLFAFMASLVTYMVMGLAIVFALTQLGVQTASLIALVGAAGLAIALALQDTLKAVAGGVMLAIFRPYRIGDWVNIAGREGEVTDISPFRTTIKPVTNSAVSLPNDKVWTESISNSSRYARRRLDLYVDVSYEDDTDFAIEKTHEAINDLSRVLAKSETWVGVHAFRDSSVQLRCRAWVAMPEYVQMKSDCLRAIKKAYDQHGITIPYPHQVEIHRGEKPSPTGQPSAGGFAAHQPGEGLDEG
jgi:small conductance mechanosensitive channel